MRSSEVSEYPTNEQLSWKNSISSRFTTSTIAAFDELYSKDLPMDEAFL